MVNGISDNRCPTSSAWVKNTVFGQESCKANYAINWAGKPPILAGDLAHYPTDCEQSLNISLIPEKCPQKAKGNKKARKHRKARR